MKAEPAEVSMFTQIAERPQHTLRESVGGSAGMTVAIPGVILLAPSRSRFSGAMPALSPERERAGDTDARRMSLRPE
jgi:hypothetical protein